MALGVNDFNSHTREGVTICRHFCRGIKPYFNSHTREGVTYLSGELLRR